MLEFLLRSRTPIVLGEIAVQLVIIHGGKPFKKHVYPALLTA